MADNFIEAKLRGAEMAKDSLLMEVQRLLAQNKALKDMLRDGISKFGDNPHPASTTEVNARHWAAMAAALYAWLST